MSSLNIRQTSEPYDPTQRLVGGVVLVLLMLLLYAVLKTLLGISADGAAYALRNALPEETLLSSPETPAAESTGNAEAGAPRYSIVEGFVFLDLKGNPMLAAGQTASGVVEQLPGEPVSPPGGEKRWVVQAASFREQEQADKFVAQLKAKQLETSVVKTSNNWYAVRLPAQNNRRLAEQQLLELRQKTGKKGLLLQLE
jgi:hypothetical protein